MAGSMNYGTPASNGWSPTPAAMQNTTPNIYQQSNQWLNQAAGMAGTPYSPMQVNAQPISAPNAIDPRMINAATIQAGQLKNTDISKYMNPYTDNVINTTLNDINRSRRMAINDIGAQAAHAGAFGGSRLGVAEAETNRGYGNIAAQTIANLHNTGYQNAQQAALSDIGNRLQQSLANQNAQMGARTANQGADLSAQNANAGYQYQTGVQNAGNNLQAQLANQGAGLSGNAQNMQQASLLGDLSNLGFGFGQQINGNLAAQGQQQQNVNQALIDAAKGNWQGFTGKPKSDLATILAAIQGMPVPMSSSTSQNPGLLNLLSTGAQAAAMFL